MVTVENPRETTSVVDVEAGGMLRRLHYSFPQRFEKAFQLEVDHFVRCLEGMNCQPQTGEKPGSQDSSVIRALDS